MKNSLFPIITLALLVSIQACKPTSEIVEYDEQVTLDTIDIEPEDPRLYQAAEKRVNDIVHTKLEVSFDWDSTYLYGKAYLTVTPYFYPVDTLTLDAKGFQIHQVALLDKLGKKQALKFNYDSSYIKIALNKTYLRTDTYQVFIDYTAMPNKLDAGGSAAITSDIGLYFINPDGSDPNKPKQIWTQGETEASSCWFPTIDAPNEKTSQEIYITVDTIYETLSNGALMFQTENGDGTRTDYWKQELPHAPYLFMMAVGDFAVVEDEWRGKPVNYYVEHKYKDVAADIYPNTPEMLEFFSERLDYEYPWDKFHQVVVRDYVSGAMENTGAVIYGEFVQGNSRYLIDNSGEDVVAHEMFHHWFGDLVTCESWANLPLNESFATYGEYLWNEYKYGKDEADYGGYNDLRVYLQSTRTGTKKLIRFDYEHRMEMFDAHSYQKGGRVLHMLRNYLGDDAFFAALKLYLHENEFQPAEIHNLRLAFEEVSGEDLNWFFNQWFLAAGHPIIEVEKNYIDSTNTLEVIVEQTQDGDETPEVFEIYTDIEIVENGKRTVEPVHITERKQTFTFNLESAPSLVNFDTEKIILGQVKQDFEESEAVALYKHGGNLMDRYEAIKELKRAKSGAALNTIETALKDPHWKIRETALDNSKNLIDEKKANLLSVIKEMALKDDKSNVRAKAYQTLNKYYEEELNAELIMNGIQDSSYRVVSSALDILFEVNSDKGLEEAKKLESEDNTNIKLVVANIYAEDGSKDHKAFFETMIAENSGFTLYPLMASYSTYLEKQDKETVSNAIPVISKLAMEEDAWFVRMAGINALGTLKKKYEGERDDAQERINNKEEGADISKFQESVKASAGMVDMIKAELEEIKKGEENKNLLRMLSTMLE